MTDVIIIGNGLTGGTLACALAQQGLKVVLIDRQDPQSLSPGDGKSFALSQSSQSLFSSLGIWEALDTVTPIKTIHTSDGMRPQRVTYQEEDVKAGPLGYVVDSGLLKSKILERVFSYHSSSFLTLHAPATLVRFERTLFHTLIETTQGQIFTAPLCVASDGGFSPLRQKANIPLRERAYDQVAIVCNMAHSLPHHHQAFEHFLASGPLAFLPRPGNTSGLVWSIETKKASWLLSLSSSAFAEEVESFFGTALGKLTLISERQSHPLRLCLPTRLIDKRLALVGEAAHTFHPVAGQGLNVGLRDVTVLRDLIVHALSLGLDLGSSTVLDRYQKMRERDVRSMAFFTDKVVRVFSTQNPLMARARSLGFGAVTHCPPLKNFMIRRAMGI